MEEVGIVRILAAFAFVIGLILLMSWGLKRARGSQWMEKVQGEKRLHMVEQLYLDARHKLVLVKCDEAEHLIMIGDGQMMPHKKATQKAASK